MQGINIQEKNIGETSDSLYLGFPFWPSCVMFQVIFKKSDLPENKSVSTSRHTLPGKRKLFHTCGLAQANKKEDDENNQKPDLYDQQLKISLDLIDRSSFFICLLGHSYGQCLPAEHGSQSDIRPCSLSELARNLYVAAEAGYPWVWRMSIAPVALQSWRSPRQPSLTTTEAASSILKTALHRTQRTTAVMKCKFSWTCCPLKAKVRDRDWEI